MFFVSYHDRHGIVRNKQFPSYTQAERLASEKAIDPKACPVILVDQDGHVWKQINK
jgi:hypothetical protein